MSPLTPLPLLYFPPHPLPLPLLPSSPFPLPLPPPPKLKYVHLTGGSSVSGPMRFGEGPWAIGGGAITVNGQLILEEVEISFCRGIAFGRSHSIFEPVRPFIPPPTTSLPTPHPPRGPVASPFPLPPPPSP